MSSTTIMQQQCPQIIRTKFFTRIGLLPTAACALKQDPPTTTTNINSPLAASTTPTSPSSVVPTVAVEALSCSPTLPMLQLQLPLFPLTRPPVNMMTEPLKYDPVADAHYSSKSSKRQRPAAAAACNGNSNNNKKKKKRNVGGVVGFQESVQVMPIPMRTEYSVRVRSRLWTTEAELYINAARNTVEFAYEGWDWRNVMEDEHMHVCKATGELIHPCHYSILGKDQGNE